MAEINWLNYNPEKTSFMSRHDHIPLPNFYIIGAAKAGTTSLFNILKQHPQVFLPFSKEPLFFSHDDLYKRGIDWYLQTYFYLSDGFSARGEASPHYLYWAEKVALRIKKTYDTSKVKFIIMLRDPVARAYSWYWNMVMEGRESLPFKDALEKEENRLRENWDDFYYRGSMTYGYVRGSQYTAALASYLEIFPSESFHYILLDDLGINFKQTMKQVLEFLQLDASIDIYPSTSNPATKPRSMVFQKWLRRQNRLRKLVLSLIPMRIRYAVITKFLRANSSEANYPVIEPDLEKELRLRFAPEIERLSTIIHRDLSSWMPR